MIHVTEDIFNCEKIDSNKMINDLTYFLRMGAIRKFGGHISKAARFLGMRRTTLSQWIINKGHKEEFLRIQAENNYFPYKRTFVEKPVKPQKTGLAKIYTY